MREQGRDVLDYPGGAARVAQAVDVDLLARAIAWSGEAEAARNEAFNVTNGDVLVWENIWPAIADALRMKPGKSVPLSLVKEFGELGRAMGRAAAQARSGRAGVEGVRRAVVPVRRLQHALWPDRARSALDRLDGEDQPRRLHRDDGHRGHVPEVVRGGAESSGCCRSLLFSLSPFLRGEGWGEGLFAEQFDRQRVRGAALRRRRASACPTSPRRRGEVKKRTRCRG